MPPGCGRRASRSAPCSSSPVRCGSSTSSTGTATASNLHNPWMSDAAIRNGSPADVPFMKSMLAHAYGWRVNAFDADIPLTRYVDNWGRPGDVALVATEKGHPVGAAWLRVFRPDAPGYGFIDEQTPEVTISIV